MNPAQAFSVKRAQVEFHNFASLGQPERVLPHYAAQNANRGAIISRHLEFMGGLSPFLEIGANAGHTSYMLANQFGADGFALDISADSLRHGAYLQDAWAMPRSPVRLAGDAVNLPFADGSLRMVLACQMLSQFLDIEKVFIEVKRVLAPGGIFMFTEEPMRRSLSLRLYRCPYYNTMKPWERKLHDAGLLGYLVRDVIGAHQEESFGIRQNHRMYLADWERLVNKHFAAAKYELLVPGRGWGETIVKELSAYCDPDRSWRTASRWLGGTMSALCRKAGSPASGPQTSGPQASGPQPGIDDFEQRLRCPDCHHKMRRERATESLHCTACPYAAANEGGVYNLLASADRNELYPGDRPDIIDFSLPGHAHKLRGGWWDVEGIYGNKFRWMTARGEARLERVHAGPAKVRIRGHAPDREAAGSRQIVIAIDVNGIRVGEFPLERTGLFVLEVPVPDSAVCDVVISASPVWQAAGDLRDLSVTISMIRLIPEE